MATELIIPPGYGLLTASFACDGASRLATITCGFKATGIVDPTVCVLAWRTALTGSGNVFDQSNISDQWSSVQFYCLLNSGGTMYSHTDNTVETGGLGIDTSPINTSVIVSKTVAPAGRRYRGHMSFPPCNLAENQIDAAGAIDTTARGNLQALVTGLFNDMVAGDIPPYLLHNSIDGGAVPPPTQITEFRVRAQIGTSRHRLKRL